MWTAAAEDTLAQFIKEKGFNAVEAEMDRLEMCRRNGLYARLGGDINAMLKAAPKLRNDPAVFCYFISDRRRRNANPFFAQAEKLYRQADPNHPTIVINRALWNEFSFFVDEVKPRLLDYYHYHWDGRRHPERHYVYLAMFRELAHKNHVPLMRCVGAGVPPANLRQTLYSSLAYGVKGFHFWPPWHFGYKKDESGPVLKDGKIEPTLAESQEPASEVARAVRKIEPVLLAARSVAVYHADPLPAGGQKTPKNARVQLSGENVLVGVFEHEGKKPRDYLLLVNRDVGQPRDATLGFTAKVTAVEKMDKATGKWRPLKLETREGSTAVRLSLQPGDGEFVRVVGEG